MYSTHNEGKPVVAHRFIRALKGNTNTIILIYHHSIGKKPVDALKWKTYWCIEPIEPIFFLTEEIEANPKAPKFVTESRLLSTKIILARLCR